MLRGLKNMEEMARDLELNRGGVIWKQTTGTGQGINTLCS